MKLIFDESLGRVFSRNNAMGYKSLEISEDLQRGDDFTVSFQGDKIVLVKDDSTVEGEEPIYAFITKEFGLYGCENLKTSINVILCDEVMLVILFDGSIAIRPEGNLMAASRGTQKLPTCRADIINWISVTQLISYCVNFGTYAKKYPYDYEYPLSVRGGISSGLKQVMVGKFHDVSDISCGNFERLDEEKKRREDAKATAKMAKSLFNFGGESAYEVNDDDNDYDEDYDDDEDY